MAGLVLPPADLAGSKPMVGRPLPAWRPGVLDIHYIATGRGDATLIVAPDGRTALIDAGAVVKPDPAQVAATPNASRSPGEWIARYIARRLAETGRSGLDAIAATHLHPDHIGGVAPDSPPRAAGAYLPTGLSEVAARLPVAKLLDPDFPDYRPDGFEDVASAANFVAFARSFAAGGGRVEKLRAGATGQVLSDSPDFTIRTVASRGHVWTGAGSGARDLFPARDSLPPGDRPNENAGSAAFLIAYGPFRYVAGGDLTDWADAGSRPWLNALTPAARAIGPVDVATLPHHGMFDAGSPTTIGAFRSKDWVISAWHAAHPSPSTLEAAFSERLYPGARRVWATALHPAADLAMRRLTSRLSSQKGHVVCRVENNGQSYRMIVTDNGDEGDCVAAAGPVTPAGSWG